MAPSHVKPFVKHHKNDAVVAQTVNRYREFFTLFKDVFGRKIPRRIVDKFENAQKILNNVLNRKIVNEWDFRKAIVAIIEYATEFNDKVFDLGGF